MYASHGMTSVESSKKRPFYPSPSHPSTDLSEFMHERNIYKGNPPDFDELARLYECFKPCRLPFSFGVFAGTKIIPESNVQLHFSVQYTKRLKPFIDFKTPEA